MNTTNNNNIPSNSIFHLKGFDGWKKIKCSQCGKIHPSACEPSPKK